MPFYIYDLHICIGYYSFNKGLDNSGHICSVLFCLKRSRVCREMGCGNFKKPRGVYKYEFICKINCFMNELGVKLMVVVLWISKSQCTHVTMYPVGLESARHALSWYAFSRYSSDSGLIRPFQFLPAKERTYSRALTNFF